VKKKLLFDPTSRYFHIEDAELTNNFGEIIRYKKRRFIPRSEENTILQELTIIAGDRLDNISARIYDDPLQFWEICDANGDSMMHPLELTEVPGTVIRIPLPGRR
jgi:hypothetical protein